MHSQQHTVIQPHTLRPLVHKKHMAVSTSEESGGHVIGGGLTSHPQRACTVRVSIANDIHQAVIYNPEQKIQTLYKYI